MVTADPRMKCYTAANRPEFCDLGVNTCTYAEKKDNPNGIKSLLMSQESLRFYSPNFRERVLLWRLWNSGWLLHGNARFGLHRMPMPRRALQCWKDIMYVFLTNVAMTPEWWLCLLQRWPACKELNTAARSPPLPCAPQQRVRSARYILSRLHQVSK